jgi:hypothetical protein
MRGRNHHLRSGHGPCKGYRPSVDDGSDAVPFDFFLDDVWLLDQVMWDTILPAAPKARPGCMPGRPLPKCSAGQVGI